MQQGPAACVLPFYSACLFPWIGYDLAEEFKRNKLSFMGMVNQVIRAHANMAIVSRHRWKGD